MLPTDWMRPTTAVLARLSDARASQYWDPAHLLAKRLSGDARDPQPKPDCCRRDGNLWDLAAVYPPGATWGDALPPAVFFNGPIVDVRDGLENVSISRSAIR
jgi:hypothetical protein